MKITNQIVIEKARQLGFELVGFAKAEELIEEAAKLEEWLSLGYQAGMKYIEKNIEKRKDVTKILSDAKSVISLGMIYYSDENYSNENNKGKVSRYAWGKDYHLIIWEKLEQLENELKKIDPDFKSQSYVDTRPVMDKAWAVRAGLGWLGKHTNVINQEMGSWFFIANIITNYEFEYSSVIADHCGSCVACIEACPTGAIVDEYVLDSNKCISYLTIENKGDIPEEFKDKFDNWLFGCDICQDVCPWNIKFSLVTQIEDFLPQKGNKEIALTDILNMDENQFKERFEESPVMRAKLKGLKRNASFIEME